MRVATIDVGSNSIHMVVAEVDGAGHFRVLDRAREMVRLGQRSLITGRLLASAIERGVQTLAAFRTLAERRGSVRFRAVATSAIREASNGGEFIQRVRDEVGIRIRVIPGREEARLIHLGVRHAVDLGGTDSLILDIGGGSVEMIVVEDHLPTAIESAKAGVSRLTEAVLGTDPPTSKQLRRLEERLRVDLDPMLRVLDGRKLIQVVGTSGTMLNLIQMAALRRGHVPGESLNGLTVSADDIARLRRRLVRMDRSRRLRIAGLDGKRVDLIVAGTIVADRVIRRSGAKRVVACSWALREGLLLDYIGRHGKGIEEVERFPDVRRRSVERLLRHLDGDQPHVRHVARLALRLFDELAVHLGLDARAREWLEPAALLHDVGHLIDHRNHARHSSYLIRHGELFGFHSEEIDIIAHTALHHDRGPVPKRPEGDASHLSVEQWRAVRGLSAILRLAEGLDRSHYGAVRDVNVRVGRTRITVGLVTGDDPAALERWEGQRRTGVLAKLLGKQLRFSIAR
jgi:exopolyphosphatase/guanosine-5'-triphosphate,3'-diphosphate pyrophosphatase